MRSSRKTHFVSKLKAEWRDLPRKTSGASGCPSAVRRISSAIRRISSAVHRVLPAFPGLLLSLCPGIHQDDGGGAQCDHQHCKGNGQDLSGLQQEEQHQRDEGQQQNAAYEPQPADIITGFLFFRGHIVA